MRTFDFYSLVTADPISLIGLIAGGLGSAIGSAIGGGSKPPPITMPPTPPPQQQPTGSASTFKSNQPSFLSAAAATPNPQQTQSKSLLGQ